MKRLTDIDTGKGLTAFLVFVSHLVQGITYTPYFEEYDILLKAIVQILYIFHIPVFFALSGYVFKPAKGLRDYWLYFKKKTLSLLVPYIYFCIVWFSFSSLGGSGVRTAFSLADLLNIWRQPISISWFLYILWIVSVVYGFLGIYIRKPVHLVLLSFILYLVAMISPFKIYLLQRTCLWGFSFILGYYLSTLNLSTAKKYFIFLINLLFFIFYVGFWLEQGGTKISYTNPGLWALIFPISICLGLSAFSLLPSSRASVHLVSLGQCAIEIYLYHSIIVSAYRIILIKLGFIDIISHIIVGLPITWGLTLLATYISRKLKPIDFFLHPLAYIKVNR